MKFDAFEIGQVFKSKSFKLTKENIGACSKSPINRTKKFKAARL